MNAMVHSLTCVSSQEQQKMLLKSLLGIVGHRANNQNEWTYLEEGSADVLVIDYDDNTVARPKVNRL